MKRIVVLAIGTNRGLTRLLIRGLFVICAMAALTTAAPAFVLVSPEEVAREQARGEPPRVRGFTKADIGAPEIVLVRPGSLKNVVSPLDIELQFLPKAPAKILRDSLRVLYGFFGLDVTDRLAKHADVTSSGVLAKDAELPAGSHRITIEIADDLDRVSRRTFRFEINNE